MKYKIIAQQTPFNCTQPQVLIKECDTKEMAYIEAYKDLTQKGYNLFTNLTEDEASNLKVDASIIKRSLPTEFRTVRMVHILSIESYNL